MVLDSIPAFIGTVESEGQQMRQCSIKYEDKIISPFYKNKTLFHDQDPEYLSFGGWNKGGPLIFALSKNKRQCGYFCSRFKAKKNGGFLLCSHCSNTQNSEKNESEMSQKPKEKQKITIPVEVCRSSSVI
jgi:hypothetical protein